MAQSHVVSALVAQHAKLAGVMTSARFTAPGSTPGKTPAAASCPRSPWVSASTAEASRTTASLTGRLAPAVLGELIGQVDVRRHAAPDLRLDALDRRGQGFEPDGALIEPMADDATAVRRALDRRVDARPLL